MAIVVGDAGLDLSVRVSHRPAADEKVLTHTDLMTAGGVAANTAAALARLGTSVGLAAAVGSDSFGQRVATLLDQAGVDLRYFRQLPTERTYYSVSLVDDSGEKGLVVVAVGRMYPPRDSQPAALPEGVSWLHTVPYDADAAAAWITLARRQGVPWSLDLEPAAISEGWTPALRSCLDGATVVFVNWRGLNLIAADELSAARALHGLGVETVLATRGADGLCLWPVDGDLIAARPPRVEVVDTTGAGDTAAAAFIHYRLAGANPGEATTRACIAGALACRGLGAQASLPSPEEIEQIYQQLLSGSRGEP